MTSLTNQPQECLKLLHCTALSYRRSTLGTSVGVSLMPAFALCSKSTAGNQEGEGYVVMMQ